jgi:hypothetical protein
VEAEAQGRRGRRAHQWRRLENLGNNGDEIDPTGWGTHTASVANRQAAAEEVPGGMMEAPNPVK